jgi:hypothetical protein
MIMRNLYRLLLRLHPVEFRERFAEELLWSYDKALPQLGSPRICADGLLSLIRQWFQWLNFAVILAVCAGAFIPLYFAAVALRHAMPRGPQWDKLDPQLGFLILVATAIVLALCFTMIFAVLFFQFSRKRRT